MSSNVLVDHQLLALRYLVHGLNHPNESPVPQYQQLLRFWNYGKPTTIKDVMSFLSNFDPSTRVLVNDSEHGPEEPTIVLVERDGARTLEFS